MYKSYSGIGNVLQLVIKPELASWSVPYPEEYDPPSYTKPAYLNEDDAVRPVFADHPDVRKCAAKLLAKQTISNFEIDAKTGQPLNPLGRQGITGRGEFGEHGPQYCADPIVSEWCTDSYGNIIFNEENMPLIKFVCIERADKGKGSGKAFAIPGGIRDRMLNKDNSLNTANVFVANPPLEDAIVAGARELGEEAFGQQVTYGVSSVDKANSLQEKFRNDGVVLLSNVVVKEDPRNTDNAWLQSTVISYHDPTCQNSKQFHLKPGASETRSFWQVWDPLNEPTLYADHNEYLRLHYKRVVDTF